MIGETRFQLPQESVVKKSAISTRVRRKLEACILLELDITKATGPDGVPLCLLRSCADGLAKSLSYNFSKSKETGKFLYSWKVACIKPLHKDGPKDNVANYHPLALLSCISKVFEKCIYDKVLDLVEPHLSDHQFGFRQRRLLVLQLLVSLSKIAESKDETVETHAVFFDLRKAFDKVDHSMLLKKLFTDG